jgi:alkylated DNA repair dioxygenase AlkB
MESDYLPGRKSLRVCARQTEEDSGKSTKVDYVSHPIDNAPVPEPEAASVKRRASSTKKTAGSSAPARAKVEKKPAATRKKAANSTPRKRTGTAAKPRSPAKNTLTVNPPPDVSAPLADKSQGIEPLSEITQDIEPLVGLAPGSVEPADADSDSELSYLAATPECPTPIRNDFPEGLDDTQMQLDNRSGEVDFPLLQPTIPTPESVHSNGAVAAVSETLAAPPSPPIQTDESVVTTNALREIYSKSPPQVPPTATRPDPALLPTTPSTLRQSGRSRVHPNRFGSLVPTPADAVDDQDTVEEQDVFEVQDPTEEKDEMVSGGDSPIAQKVSRKTKANAVAKPARRKKAVSQEKLSADDLADDVPTAKSRKRKADATTATPRKRPTKSKDAIGEASEVKARKTLVQRKTPAQRKKKENTPVTKALQLPSPAMSQSDYLEVSGLPIDPELLQLSRDLTHREPLDSKPETCGQPEVWAPGRQELCETLPYFKSAHSGCYSNGNTVYAFMFDSVGVGREYMDQDVIIARMGGHMESDPKTGLVTQKDDHKMEAKQPQSVLNNIAHNNPIIIVCGDKNVGSITKMPQRYCVLGWFKPTHVWAEKTLSKKKTMTTIRYRFERLSRAEPSWYSAAPESIVTPPPGTDLELPIKICMSCNQSCPQVYLIDWMCTNPDCTAFWEMSNGQNAPTGDLDYHPAFLLHRTTWERENAPFDLNPGVPKMGEHFGDNLSAVMTRGIVCPDCGRCNSRYMFTHWRCDTPGCRWKLQPKHEIVMPSNLGHTPWDMASDGPSLIKSVVAPVVRTQIKYFSNYKVLRYTIEGVEGAVIVAKANKHVVAEPGGADDMFREMQSVDVGLERRMLRQTASAASKPPGQKTDPAVELSNSVPTLTTEEATEQPKADENEDDDDNDEYNAEAGARMTAFGMNFGMPYKFIASGDSRSFEEAPVAVRSARSLLNWAQRVFVNDEAGYQDFNEELVFGYMENQKIKYHDDGEMGLGPRIATLSLGGGATMLLRVKAKYYSQVSNTGVFTYEEPLPLPLLESSGYTSGFRGKNKSKKPCKDTHEGRLAAWAELKALKESGDFAGFRQRSKEVAKELELKRAPCEPILSFHLTHGDIVIMEGEQIQKFLEHQVEPTGSLRFALTCRTVLGNHLTADQLPKYGVAAAGVYDRSAIREEGDGEAVVWG